MTMGRARSLWLLTRLHPAHPGPLDGAVDGGAGDAEEFGQLGGRVLAGSVQLDQVRFLLRLELGLLAAQAALVALATFIPSRVLSLIRSASNSAIIARTLNSRRPTGSLGSCTAPPMLSLTPRLARSSTMSRASGREPGQPIELGHDEGVASAAGGEGVQGVVLRGEVLRHGPGAGSHVRQLGRRPLAPLDMVDCLAATRSW
jgi:hypothetical protein